MFTAWVGGPNGGARILDLDTRKVRPITAAQADRAGSFTPPARWSASGHLILERWDAGLQVIPFDPDSPKPVSLADGNVEPVVSQKDVDEYCSLGGRVTLSPDGERVLVGNGGAIVEIDLERPLPHRITDEDGVTGNAFYAPDGRHVIYASNREERWALWSVGTAPGSTPELVLRRDRSIFPSSVGPGGGILFGEASPETNGDIWIRTPQGDVSPGVATRAEEKDGVFSPDGTWIAYASNETGEFEVYMRPLAPGAAPIQVSTGGGDAPQWGPRGTTLYFRRERKVLRVGFDHGRLAGDPRIVFDAPNLLTWSSYALFDDETRMVAVQKDDAAIPDEIRIVTGFFDDIRRIAGPGSRS